MGLWLVKVVFMALLAVGLAIAGVITAVSAAAAQSLTRGSASVVAAAQPEGAGRGAAWLIIGLGLIAAALVTAGAVVTRRVSVTRS
jgi:hypothetical protein